MNKILHQMYEDLLELPSKVKEGTYPALCFIVGLVLLVTFLLSVSVFFMGSVALLLGMMATGKEDLYYLSMFSLIVHCIVWWVCSAYARAKYE